LSKKVGRKIERKVGTQVGPVIDANGKRKKNGER
jgi:hypothetical protein